MRKEKKKYNNKYVAAHDSERDKHEFTFKTELEKKD